jgi:nitrate/nitrite transporter NarK
MNTHLKNIAIIIIATFIGYASMGLFITAVQEWIFNGVNYHKSSLTVLAIAGLGTFLSAVAGGWIAFKINSSRTRFSNYIMCILVICETTWLINTHRADNPIWFEVLAATSLIVGILVGCNLDYFRKSRNSFSAFAN